jgi:hypothetical protein
MDVIIDWNLGNMIYNGLVTLRRCGFPFTEIEVVSLVNSLMIAIELGVRHLDIRGDS